MDDRNETGLGWKLKKSKKNEKIRNLGQKRDNKRSKQNDR